MLHRNTLLLWVVALALLSADVPVRHATVTHKQKGVCWVASREKVTAEQFTALVDHHVTWISQTPFGWQRKADSAAIQFETRASDGKSRGVMWGESDEGITETTRLAKANGIKTLLKPHLWVRGSWPGEIEMKTDAEWLRWFQDYEKFILHYARLAEQQQIEALCIGTELSKAALKEAQWRTLIQKIKKVYHGKLTYAANFHNEFEHVKFWDLLDFIGIQAYFPLTTKTNPALEDLTSGWSKHCKTIEMVAHTFKKPVVFTEIGYRSTHDAAIEPWIWPQHLSDKAIPSEDVQAVCYEAFFKSVWNKPWMGGVYFWKWYPQGGKRMTEIDFTPQGKKAQEVMKLNFKKP